MADAHLGESFELAQQDLDGKHPLEEWQLAFCKWLAAHQRARTKEQEIMASELAGTAITWVEIRRMRAQKNFRNWYARYRRKILQRIEDARESFESVNVPKAVETHSWALDAAKAEGDFRAVGPLVEPAIKAMYKQVNEETQKPMIILNLGGFAQAHLTEPATVVEYEQLESGDDDNTPN